VGRTVVNDGSGVNEGDEGEEKDGRSGKHDESDRLVKIIKMTGRKKAPGLRMKDW